MSSINPLDPLQAAQPQSETQAEASRRAAASPRGQGDIVDVKARSLAWQRMDAEGEEPISRDQAFATMQTVASAPLEQLALVHSGLDPQRVFQLLGLNC